MLALTTRLMQLTREMLAPSHSTAHLKDRQKRTSAGNEGGAVECTGPALLAAPVQGLQGLALRVYGLDRSPP